jgi:putative ATP-dependent endonuclease of OLD family
LFNPDTFYWGSMDIIESLAIKVKNYKCFGDEEQGFTTILPINVIIGRNNSGKSTLLELIQYVAHPFEDFQKLGHKGNTLPEVFLTQPAQETELRTVFKEDAFGGPIGRSHWLFGSKLIGSTIRYKLKPDGQREFINIDTQVELPQGIDSMWTQLAHRMPNPLSGKIFKRLRAERDIVPEGDVWPPVVKENGYGTTSTIVAFITNSSLPSKVVEVELLDSLNRIYEPDCSFSRISVQRISHGTAAWEVYLIEKSTQIQVPLSQTGSGFKTILLILVYLHLIPLIEQQPPHNYIFAFEEPENNLHPAVQRRLMSFIRDFALEHGCYTFITTHSNIIIDMFSRDNTAQIIHTTHDGTKAVARRVLTYVDNKGICDDLGIRASDLLQANSVFWVEGPSDRLYVNRWIDLWSNGELKEGIHYQCMFYGGRLLAHISVLDPEEKLTDAIPILRLNRNAIFLMDSDKKTSSDKINNTKKRIAQEITDIGGLAWVTDGREVENYIPPEAIAKHYGKSPQASLGKYEDLADYLDKNIGKDEGKRFEKAKVEFAATVCPLLSKDNLQSILDLPTRLTEICEKIRAWNQA